MNKSLWVSVCSIPFLFFKFSLYPTVYFTLPFSSIIKTAVNPAFIILRIMFRNLNPTLKYFLRRGTCGIGVLANTFWCVVCFQKEALRQLVSWKQSTLWLVIRKINAKTPSAKLQIHEYCVICRGYRPYMKLLLYHLLLHNSLTLPLVSVTLVIWHIRWLNLSWKKNCILATFEAFIQGRERIHKPFSNRQKKRIVEECCQGICFKSWESKKNLNVSFRIPNNYFFLRILSNILSK